MIPVEFKPKEFPLHKPFCDSTIHRSDIYVIFTNDGEMDIAVYDEKKKLWYSPTDPTGFNNVSWFVKFDIPEGFAYSKDLLDLLYGEGDYDIHR